jgi:two-component system cell cycle sensor histidine kinase/response regulator CckA
MPGVKTDELLASVVDFLPLGVWIARAPGGELVLANRVFREIMGMEARDDVTRGEYTQPYGIHTRDGTPYPEHRLPFVRAMEQRTTVVVDDIVIHRTDGGRVFIRAHARPIFDGDEITHVVIAFADMSHEERDREAHRLEALGTLAAGVAHDFNNAMASVRVLATMLRLREKDPARVDDLRRIEDATDRAASLTRQLLDFGRHAPSRSGRLSLDQVARTVLDLVRRTFDPTIELAYKGRRDGAWVAGDPTQIEQLLMNLLVNARDAMPDGGRIRVRLAGDDHTVILEVTDSGPGIPPEMRARIFEPYFTTKARGETPGTGLGLSTAFGIVRAHGGEITIADAEPHGAKFVVRLPGAAAGLAEGSSPSVVQRGHGRVLLVEDDEQVRRSTRHLLEFLGYEVVEAADGLDAVDVFRDQAATIDAIVLDIVMPRQGGRLTLPALRAIRAVPVVVTSGIATLDELDEWRGLGATALLSKPYDLGALSTALADAIAAT